MVTIEEWCDVVRRHPLKYKFHGIRGCHASLRDALLSSERFVQDYYYRIQEDMEKSLNKCLESPTDAAYDEIEGYYRFVVAQHNAFTIPLDVIEDVVTARRMDTSIRLEDMVAAIRKLEAAADERYKSRNNGVTIGQKPSSRWRDEFIQDCVPTDCLDHEDGSFFDAYAKEYYVEGCLDHASGDFVVPLDRIFFICPSCHRQPVDLCDFYDDGRVQREHFYCGLCGASDCLDKGQTLIDFFKALEVEMFPFCERRRVLWNDCFASYFSLAPGDDRHAAFKAGFEAFIRRL